jgi:hypothetical protein
VSTEPLSRETAPDASAPGQQCSACGAPIAANQRYCLECGERLAPISGFLLGAQGGPGTASSPPSQPPTPPMAESSKQSQRSGLLLLLAGIGVLLLAMGVGVLIGRAGSSNSTPPVHVVTVPASTAAGGTAAETAFKSDWPSGTSGYTVELRTLPVAGTTAAQVTAAKAAASAKGASAVGALASSEYASLPRGTYVIYSGVYHSQAQAQKALASLHKSFPSASVVHVASAGGGHAGSSTSGGSSGGNGAGSSITHPAPPTVLKKLNKKGKSYEEESKNLPNVVETG